MELGTERPGFEPRRCLLVFCRSCSFCCFPGSGRARPSARRTLARRPSSSVSPALRVSPPRSPTHLRSPARRGAEPSRDIGPKLLQVVSHSAIHLECRLTHLPTGAADASGDTKGERETEPHSAHLHTQQTGEREQAHSPVRGGHQTEHMYDT